MLENGAKVLDADDDVKFVLDFDIIKLVHLYRNVSVEGLFEHSYVSVSTGREKHGIQVVMAPSLLTAPRFCTFSVKHVKLTTRASSSVLMSSSSIPGPK
jgi:hypothetical protein